MPTFLGIPMSFDPAASVLAVLAVGIALQVYRTTTCHRARIVSFDQSWSHGVDGMSRRFSVVIRNSGIPIREPRVSLAFQRYDDDGRPMSCTYHLGAANGIFEHGDLCEFEVQLKIPVEERHRIGAEWLQCFAKQTPGQTRPRIVIYSGKFEVVSLPLVSRLNGLITYWNFLTSRLNRKLDRTGQFADGESWIKPGQLLPKVGLQAWPALQCIGKDLSRELARTSEDPQVGG